MKRGHTVQLIGCSCSGKTAIIKKVSNLLPEIEIWGFDQQAKKFYQEQLAKELPLAYKTLIDLGIEPNSIYRLLFSRQIPDKAQPTLKEIRENYSLLKLKDDQIRPLIKQALTEQIEQLAQSGVNVIFENTEKLETLSEAKSAFIFCPLTLLSSRFERKKGEIAGDSVYQLGIFTYLQYANLVKNRTSSSEPLLEILEKEKVVDSYHKLPSQDRSEEGEKEFLLNLGFGSPGVKKLEITSKDQAYALWINTALYSPEKSAQKIVSTLFKE